MDIEARIDYGYDRGLEQELERGKARAKRENARKMKALGSSSEFIQEVTGLSPQEIEQL